MEVYELLPLCQTSDTWDDDEIAFNNKKKWGSGHGKNSKK